MTTLFIADLHLSGQRPAIAQLFNDFLTQQARDAERLFILGDLFEAWLGDDAVMPDQQPALDALAALTRAGTEVFFMHGNRDFLIGAGVEQRTGGRVLPENTVIDLYGQRVLLAHGDALCTDDVEYQKVRSMARNPEWQRQALALPIPKRIELAQHYRAMSKTQKALLAEDIMDVNQGAVEDTLRQHHVLCLIHGHTHRPALHRFVLDGKEAQRWVLGDWRDQPSVLVCRPDVWRLHDPRVGADATMHFGTRQAS